MFPAVQRWVQWVMASPEADRSDTYWRSLFYYNGYRLVVGGVLVLIPAIFGAHQLFGSRDLRLFLYGAVAYVIFGGFSAALINSRRPRFNLQLGLQVGGDVMFFVLLLYASGGIQSGLGLLLTVSLAAAGLISRGRMTLFFASLATIGVLLEESYLMLQGDDFNPVQYVQAGLLSMGYFAIAWLSHMLARYTLESEQLARQRGIDLANMAQVNQLVIQDMQDGVLVVDGDGRVRQGNSQAERLLGRPLAPSGKVSLLDYSGSLAERLRAWQTDRAADFDLMRVAATNRLVRTRFVPVNANRSRGAVIFLEDMSRVQSQAQQLKLAALGRLTANIAHEIRNPLSAISHAAELLLEEKAADLTQSRLLHIIRENTRRLDHMVRDVLQLNRRDRAKPEYFKADGFIHAFMDEFCQIEKILPATVSVNIAPGLTLCFDRGHLNQVLWNLCRNAWRHCSKGEGSIRLTLRDGMAENTVNLDLVDDGPGIAPALRNQLFEPFFTTVATGTGLGLYIAREICEANGATLECVESDGGGHFRITIRRENVKAQGAGDAIGGQ
ncbi:MAG: PAS domain-containing protein [Betaproteobacteria bacterium]|nr:PAS domain-containing protein [Betaproteobacteria bacterium]